MDNSKRNGDIVEAIFEKCSLPNDIQRRMNYEIKKL